MLFVRDRDFTTTLMRDKFHNLAQLVCISQAGSRDIRNYVTQHSLRLLQNTDIHPDFFLTPCLPWGTISSVYHERHKQLRSN